MRTVLIALLWIGLWSLTTACDSDLKVTTAALGPAETTKVAREGDCIDPDLKNVPNDIVLTLCNGEKGQGELDLSSLMPAECAADGAVGCVTNEAFKAADMNLANATNIKSSVAIAGLVGTVIPPAPCASDGEMGCVTNVDYKATKIASFTAANIAGGVTIAGVLGAGATESHGECASDAAVGCVTTATYKSANTGAYLGSDIKSGITIAGVAGSLADCTDGASGCFVGPTFKAAVSADLAAGNVKDGVTIAGVVGSHGPACASDGSSSCLVDGTTYKAAATATAVAGNIKKGVALAGVTGDYPSSTYPLAGANAGIADLDTATFNTKIKSSADFEWFDSVGNPYVHAGETNIAAGLILNGVSIFGTVGSYVPGAMSVSSLSATRGTSKVVLSWTRSGGTGVIIVRRAGASVSFTPSHGVTYASGYTSGSDEVVYAGSAATVDDTDVDEGTTYYYKAFAYNGDHAYSAASSEASVFFTDWNGVCGGMGDSCYSNIAATTIGTATTPLGKNLEYVTASGSFKVWKEVGTNKILRANGLDEWAMKLNLDGKGFQGAGNEFTGYTSLEGRTCPPSVYIDDSDKVSANNCLYYTVGYAAQPLNVAGTSQSTASTIGLSSWSSYNGGSARWYVGNIKTCSDKGMRLPTAFETTTTTTTNTGYPSDATPTFAGATNGIPSHASGYTWTASAYTSASSNYWRWFGSAVTYTNGDVGHSNYVRCALP